MKCIRKDCQNEAIVHPTYGIIPCARCQARDVRHGRIPKRKFEFASVRKLHRIQEQRDAHSGDLVQPYERGQANPDYFRQYPDQVATYGVEKELEKA